MEPEPNHQSRLFQSSGTTTWAHRYFRAALGFCRENSNSFSPSHMPLHSAPKASLEPNTWNLPHATNESLQAVVGQDWAHLHPLAPDEVSPKSTPISLIYYTTKIPPLLQPKPMNSPLQQMTSHRFRLPFMRTHLIPYYSSSPHLDLD